MWAGAGSVNSDTLVTLRAGIHHVGRGGITVNSDTLVTLRAGIPHVGRGGITVTLIW